MKSVNDDERIELSVSELRRWLKVLHVDPSPLEQLQPLLPPQKPQTGRPVI